MIICKVLCEEGNIAELYLVYEKLRCTVYKSVVSYIFLV